MMDAQTSRLSRGREGPPALRRCLVSGEVRPKNELLRFVVNPEGAVVPDPTGRLPGRGLWLSPHRDMLERACARNLFAKAARKSLRLPEDLAAQTERAYRRRCLDLIGLARRAGQTAAGFQKVKARLAAGEGALLIEAAGAAEDGRRKMMALAKATNPDLPVFTLFSPQELGRAIGREQAVHLLVLPGSLAARIEIELGRLSGLVQEAGTAEEIE